MKLGKLKSVSLRQIWAKEASCFTPWLAQKENLEELSANIGIDFDTPKCEYKVGDYRVDIFVTENGPQERKIVIENQFGYTDHDHLGKIITYASGVDANVVIWIAEKARTEHKNAVKWLNEHSNNVIFFLIEISAVQIDNSKPAAQFKAVVKPEQYDITQTRKKSSITKDKKRILFWQNFVEYASHKKKFFTAFNKLKPLERPYYDLKFSNKRYHFYLFSHHKGVGISVYMINQKDLFYHFKANAKKIEKELGTKLVWKESVKACTIRWYAPKISKQMIDTDLQKLFNWYMTAAFKYKDVFSKHEN